MSSIYTADNISAPALSVKTPNPFLDLASLYTPKTIKELFPLIEHYALTNGIIATAITKMAKYPVTQIVYDDENEDLVDWWKHVLEDILRFPERLSDVYQNFLAYGNVFGSVRFPTRKEAICPHCKSLFDLASPHIRLKINKGNLTVEYCPVCQALTPELEIQDTTELDIERVGVILWSPNNIGIDYNKFTGESKYEYAIDPEDKVKISSMMYPKDKLLSINQKYIEAALSKEDRVVVFSNKSIFHMKLPSLAGVDPCWGQPPCLALIKDLYYLQTIKKANEAIMNGYMVPNRYVFPSSDPSTGLPYAGANLAMWRGFITQEMARWKRDPNYIAVFPFSAGQGMFGGQGKSLLAQAEMNEMVKYVLAEFGAPQEFLFGGLQWTGTNVSLRMLENEFLYMRKLGMQFIQFIIDKISISFKKPPIKFHFTDFKMADDLQRKQLMLSLYQAQAISLSTLLGEFDLDVEKELEKRMEEAKDITKVKTLEAQNDMKMQIGLQMEQQRGQQKLQKQMIESQPQMPQGVSPIQAGQTGTKPTKFNESKGPSDNQQGAEPLPEQKPPQRKDSPV